MRRLKDRKGLVVLVVGVVIALAGVALALVIVPFTATVQSDEFAGEGLGLALSDAPSTSACDTAGYSTSGVALGIINYDINASGSQNTGKFLCVTNQGFTSLSQIDVSGFVDGTTEVGCSPAESITEQPGGGGAPSGCGSVGELGAVVQFDLTLATTQGPGSGICQSASSLTDLSTSNLYTAGSFEVGSVCIYQIHVSTQAGVTETQKMVASTDTLDFRIDVGGTA